MKLELEISDDLVSDPGILNFNIVKNVVDFISEAIMEDLEGDYGIAELDDHQIDFVETDLCNYEIFQIPPRLRATLTTPTVFDD